MSAAAIDRVAKRFNSRFHRTYAKWKLRSDPLFPAILERVRFHGFPLIDVGCGIGVMAVWLRENGVRAPIRGIDYDAAKVAAAVEATADCDAVDFIVGDVREARFGRGSVLLLDVLQYFDADDQARILAKAADAVLPGGMVIIRDALNDGSWRHRATVLLEWVARAIGWMKSGRITFPTRDAVFAAFPAFEGESIPLWGKTPFNSYLFVFKRPASGTTNE